MLGAAWGFHLGGCLLVVGYDKHEHVTARHEVDTTNTAMLIFSTFSPLSTEWSLDAVCLSPPPPTTGNPTSTRGVVQHHIWDAYQEGVAVVHAQVAES